MCKVDKTSISDNNPKIQEVKAAIKKVNDKRMYLWYHVIYLRLKGRTNTEILGIVNLCKHTVGYYINAYKSDGLPGLAIGKSTCAPRLLNKEHEQSIFEVITTKIPNEVGSLNRYNRGSTILMEWIKNFGVKYSSRGILIDLTLVLQDRLTH